MYVVVTVIETSKVTIFITVSVCCAQSLQSCPTLCDPMNYGQGGSSVHRILQVKYWSQLPFSPPGDLPNPGVEPGSPALQVDSYCWVTGKAMPLYLICLNYTVQCNTTKIKTQMNRKTVTEIWDYGSCHRFSDRTHVSSFLENCLGVCNQVSTPGNEQAPAHFPGPSLYSKQETKPHSDHQPPCPPSDPRLIVSFSKECWKNLTTGSGLKSKLTSNLALHLWILCAVRALLSEQSLRSDLQSVSVKHQGSKDHF